MRKVSPGDGKTTCGGNVAFVHIAGGNRHIRAVIAIKNQWKGVPVFNAEEHQRREALFIGNQMAGIAAHLVELFPQEAAHMFIADARQHRRT